MNDKELSSKEHATKLYLIPAIILLLISQLDWAYGFYQLLRVVVTFTAVYHASSLYDRGNELWSLYAGIAVLFNPFLPVHLDRSNWAIIDLVTAFIFVRGVIKNQNE